MDSSGSPWLHKGIGCSLCDAFHSSDCTVNSDTECPWFAQGLRAALPTGGPAVRASRVKRLLSLSCSLQVPPSSRQPWHAVLPPPCASAFVPHLDAVGCFLFLSGKRKPACRFLASSATSFPSSSAPTVTAQRCKVRNPLILHSKA